MSLFQKSKVLSIFVMFFTCTTFTVLFSMVICFPSTCLASENAHHIYVDQAKGVNSSDTQGTEANPFKSVTYAMLMTGIYLTLGQYISKQEYTMLIQINQTMNEKFFL